MPATVRSTLAILLLIAGLGGCDSGDSTSGTGGGTGAAGTGASGATTGGGGNVGGGGTGGSQLGNLGDPCMTGTDCLSGVCLGGTCQKPCSTVADCPPGPYTCEVVPPNTGPTCVCSGSSPETCDGTDQNCDGLVDNNAPCDPGYSCKSGTCQCDKVCEGNCVDVLTNDDHCGDCFVKCAFGGLCDMGVCKCPTGETDCNGICADLMTSESACGVCGSPCPLGGECVQGVCECPAGEDVCGSFCVDLKSENINCGTCGNICPTGAPCVNGVCDCPGNAVACGPECVVIESDPTHCGSCDTVCPSAASCVAGQCECPTDWTLCPAGCAPLDYDQNNCGMCGKVCPAGGPHTLPVCENGACTTICDNGYANCNGLAADGCEIHVLTNNLNCGECGHSCLGAACGSGACTPTDVAIGFQNPRDIVLDAANVYINAFDGVYKFPQSGGAPALLASDPNLPARLLLDGGDLYWTSTFGNAIVKVPTAGGSTSSVYTNEVQPWGLDKIGGTLVWTSNGATNRIRAAILPGAPVDLTTSTGTATELVVADNSVFFMNLPSGLDEICSTPLAGGPVTVLATTNISSLVGNAGLAVDSTHVYWATGLTSAAGYVARVPRTGGAVEILAPMQDEPTDVAVDGNYVYWAEQGDWTPPTPPTGKIRRMLKTGGPILDLAKGVQPSRIAVGSTHVFWTHPVQGQNMGKVQKAPK